MGLRNIGGVKYFNMDNQLQVVSDKDAFLAMLNKATGNTNMPVIPMIRFNAQTGKFMRDLPEDKKDKEKKIFNEDIGTSIDFHIITLRKQVKGGYDAGTGKWGLFSQEFQDDYVEVRNLNNENEIVLKGDYKYVKGVNDNLIYFQSIYCFVDDKPYRFQISKSKLIHWFPFLKEFTNDNPARWICTAKCGELETKGASKYYNLLFSKKQEIADIPMIVKRVNDINQYLEAYASSISKKPIENYEQPEIEQDYSQETYQIGNEVVGKIVDKEQIDITNIPF